MLYNHFSLFFLKLNMTSTKTLLATFFLIALSCKKENTALQSSGSSDESTIQTLVTDVNDPAANAVRIGNQVWMTRNLNVTRYRNGDPIPQVKNPAKWASLTTGAWCWYENNSANGPKYGRLYNWYAVNDPRGLAPAGWHIPSDAEWTILSNYLGQEGVAGGNLKATGTVEAGTGLWRAPNTGASNSSGFTALPGSKRLSDGNFYSVYSIGYSGCWWSSTEALIPANRAYYREIYYGYALIGSGNDLYQAGLSVRCIRD